MCGLLSLGMAKGKRPEREMAPEDGFSSSSTLTLTRHMLESLFLAVVLTVFLGKAFPFISVCPGTWKWPFPFTEFC